MKAEVITLTPELAQKLLGTNSDNRPLSRPTIEKYSASIKRGEWQLNGEPIIIFSDGGLGDGQHRCQAVIKANKPIQTMIVYGVQRDSFKTMNSGKPRAASDVLSIKGYDNTHVLAVAARSYMTEFMNKTQENQITPTQVLQTIEEKPHIRYWVSRYVARRKNRIFPSFFPGVLAVASERYGIEKMEPFFDGAISGIGLSESSPVYMLRERFVAQTNSSKLAARNQRALVVKAINAYLKNKPIKRLTFNNEIEEMPKVI